MSNPIKRLNYYDHEFLRATDLTAEQTYHMTMRRLHNQVLHIWGVAQGLTLALAGTAVTVAPGVAIDSQGREMVINTSTNLDLTNMPVSTTQYVIIAYAEQTSDHTTEAGADGDTRWTEQPTISMATAVPADTSLSLLLGQITRAQDGSFSVSTPNRQKAATVLPDDLAANSLSLKSPAATPAQWPRLSSTGPNQAALNGSLTASGDINGNNVVAAAYLNGAAANVAGIVNCDQVIQKNPAPDLSVKNSVAVGTPATSGSKGSISASGSISGKDVTAASSLTVGPLSFPEWQEGSVFATGATAQFNFARRNLTAVPASPAAGDQYAWHNDTGVAQLWTPVNGQLVSVTSDGKVGIGTTTPSQKLDVQGSINASSDVACNRFYTGPMGSPEGTGSIFASGTWAELGFARRNLTTWPANPAAGDRYVWVNGDGSHATLWTDVAGDLLSVTKDGNVNATGKVTCTQVVQTNPAPGTRQILIGSYDKSIGTLPDGQWYFGQTVTFPTAFTDTPVVQASLSRVDVDGNVKVQVYTESVSKTDFVLKFHTWGNGTVWNLSATWVAVL